MSNFFRRSVAINKKLKKKAKRTGWGSMEEWDPDWGGGWGRRPCWSGLNIVFVWDGIPWTGTCATSTLYKL